MSLLKAPIVVPILALYFLLHGFDLEGRRGPSRREQSDAKRLAKRRAAIDKRQRDWRSAQESIKAAKAKDEPVFKGTIKYYAVRDPQTSEIPDFTLYHLLIETKRSIRCCTRSKSTSV